MLVDRDVRPLPILHISEMRAPATIYADDGPTDYDDSTESIFSSDSSEESPNLGLTMSASPPSAALRHTPHSPASIRSM